MAEEGWIVGLRQRADRPPVRPRELLCIGPAAAPVGSLEPAIARRMSAAGLPLRPCEYGWVLEDPADAALHSLARWLEANGLTGRWRDELLAVGDAHGERLGQVERAAARPLGIATHAAHLVGRTLDGDFWVQQRAFDKATDPGLWDTMVGGLVAAGETIAITLARETAEEAGLAVEALQGLEPASRITIRRPVADGYMVEYIEIFEAVVPPPLRPVNRDGEVERFERLAPDALLERLRAGAFTLEAALILVASLERYGHLVR